MIKLLAEIRRNKFDALIYLQSRSRMSSSIDRDERFFRIAGIKNIFGTGFLKQNLLDIETTKPSTAIEPEWKFFVRLLNQENLVETSADFCETNLLLGGAEHNFAVNWLKENCGFDNSTKIVAVAPSSKWESKIWDEENYYRVIAKLIESHKIFPIVFGGLEDQETGARLIERWKTGANAAGALSVRQAAAAFSHCSLYLGNDTGTMHIAAAMKVPCAAIFSAIDWNNRWSPFGNRNMIFRETVECEGCHSAICPYNNKCLKLIDYSKVLNACSDLLDGKVNFIFNARNQQLSQR